MLTWSFGTGVPAWAFLLSCAAGRGVHDARGFTMQIEKPRIAVIACSVLMEEVECFARGLPHVAQIVYLPQMLHNEPMRLRRELQAAVSACEADAAVDVIALAYGLCSRGVEGLRHARCPIVIARAHDCVTLYLGSKERYADYLKRHPGTYWYSPGWIREKAPPGPERTAALREKYAAQFEPDDVEYLLEQEKLWMANYSRAAYVGLGPEAGEQAQQAEYTRHCAACLGWDFEHVRGDASLMRDLFLGGPGGAGESNGKGGASGNSGAHGGGGWWDAERFLVVPPGHGIELVPDESVIKTVPLGEQ